MADVRPPLSKRVKRFLRYLVVRAATLVLGLVPVRLASSLGAAFGALAALVARGERNKALDSLGRAFPDTTPGERNQLVDSMFRHLGRTAFELVCIRQIDRHVNDWVEWPPEDRGVLDAALARKKGVIFVSGHVGNWELLARRVALAGYPCQTIAREASDPRTTALIEKFRASANLKAIWRGRDGAVKEMLRALKNGEILGLLIDQDTKVQSVWVPFFGHLAKTPRAAADLALRTGAAVILGFCQRTQPGKYRLRMREVPASGEGEAASVALTAELTKGIETAIREFPEQWVWMHRRWKSHEVQPEPEVGHG